jgi:hypothetical protein
MAGALGLISITAGACDHGWIWEGADKGGPDSGTGGTIGSAETGGTFGGNDAGYGYGDGGPGTGGTVEPYPDAGFGTGGSVAPVYGTGGTPDLGGTGGTPGVGCFSVTFDHDVLCEDIVAAKDQATADCQQNSQELNTFGPAEDCHVGEARRLSYTCCPNPDSTSTSDPASCQARVSGDGRTCQSDLALDGLALTDCQALNAVVQDQEPYGSCGGDGHVYLSYECCTTDGSALRLPPSSPATP